MAGAHLAAKDDSHQTALHHAARADPPVSVSLPMPLHGGFAGAGQSRDEFLILLKVWTELLDHWLGRKGNIGISRRGPRQVCLVLR